jgi:hypothetical protein
MEPLTLTFQTKPRLYACPPEEEPHEAQVGPFRVTERFTLRPGEQDPPGLGDYIVLAEGAVRYREDVTHLWNFIHDFAEELDRCWIYSMAQPLFPVVLRVHSLTVPRGWESNLDEIDEDALPWKGDGAWLEFLPDTRKLWTETPVLPLRRALETRERYLKASGPLQTLIRLHHLGLTNPGSEGGLFFLAKALEIARSLIPGRQNRDKEANLFADADVGLRQSFDWLFEVANTRMDVRHAVRRDRPGELHPRLKGGERTEFCADADLLLRTLVCKRFDLPLLITE